ncbi:MAG: malate dehydrogenase, partial [Verrucomicrobia bacterium]|nr:malate dehydrogenase [Verrucomicrobiota bacterium]
EKIVELQLTAGELAQLKASADHVRENVQRLNL